MGARYAGDGTFAPSVSNNVSVTVNPENSSTAVSALDQYGNPFTSGPYGSFVYVRADVKGNSGYGTPTGAVNFSFSGPGNNSSSIAASLNSQANTALLNLATTFPPGQIVVTGNYSGDPSFNPSTSSPVSFTISQASTTTSLQSSGAPQGAILTAFIDTASLGSPPTGSVTFSNGSTTIGSASVTTGPLGNMTTATFNATQLANGQYSITATYSGDTNYTGSTSGSVPINVQPDFSIQTSMPGLLIASPGGAASMSVSMMDLDGFTGAVTFSCSGLPAESKCAFTPASLSATGSTTLTVTTTAPVAVSKPPFHPSSWNLAFGLLGAPMGALVIVGFTGRRRRVRLFSVMVLLAFLSACSGGSSTPPPPPPNPGTPKGIYVVTLTATNGTITHTTHFGVFVQ